MVTEETFQKYLKVRSTGQYNMILDRKEIQRNIGIEQEDYFDVIQNFSKYCKKYNIRNLQ